MAEQKIDGDQDIPTGENLILSASFAKDGEEPPGVFHRSPFRARPRRCWRAWRAIPAPTS